MDNTLSVNLSEYGQAQAVKCKRTMEQGNKGSAHGVLTA